MEEAGKCAALRMPRGEGTYRSEPMSVLRGNARGPSGGPGSGGGFGGGAYRIGGGVTAPTVLLKVEPEYSEEARKAKWQGAVMLSLVVDENGTPQQIKVTRSLGLGLDQKRLARRGAVRGRARRASGRE